MDKKKDNSDNSFGVPDDYFGKSAKAIANHLEWQEEMRPFATLSEMDRSIFFRVPDGYFSRAEAKHELIPYATIAAKKEIAFGLPEDYLSHARLRTIVSVVSGKPAGKGDKDISRMFNIPPDYFQQGQSVLKRKGNNGKGKIIRLNPRALMSMAALLLIVFSVWIYKGIFDVPTVAEDCKTIACIDKKELLNSRNFENLDNEDLYELVNSSLLEKKLLPEVDSGGKMDSLDDWEEEVFEQL